MKNRRIIDDCLALLTSWTASVNRKRTHLRRLTMTMRFLFLFGRIAASGVAMNKKSKRKKKISGSGGLDGGSLRVQLQACAEDFLANLRIGTSWGG